MQTNTTLHFFLKKRLWLFGLFMVVVSVLVLIVSIFQPPQDQTQASEFQVSSISPNSGSTLGGTRIVINGVGFIDNLANLQVKIDQSVCLNLSFISTTQLSCRTPTGTIGAKNLTVTNADGQIRTLSNGFTYFNTGPLQDSNIELMYCDTPKKVGQTVDCTLFVDIDFSVYTGSVNVKIENETEKTCSIPPSGNSMVCSGVALPNITGSHQSKFYVSNQWIDGNKVNVISDIVTDGLELYYDAGHTGSYPTSGQEIFDLSGQNHHGFLGQNYTTETADPIWVNNAYKTFNFDGVDDMIETTLHSNFSNDLSIEVWFKRQNNDSINENTLGQRLVTTYQLAGVENCSDFGDLTSGFWSYGGNACSARNSLGLHNQTIQAQSSNSTVVNSQFIPNVDWQMATLTYNSTTGENKIYVNTALHNSFTQLAGDSSAGTIKIGTLLNGVGNYQGDIAVVRIYNKVLNQTEINQNFNMEKTRFGFNQPYILINNFPTNINFNSIPVSNESTMLSSVLNNISFVDRRLNFAPWTANIAISDLVSGNNIISADQVGLNPLYSQQLVTTGSGLHNTRGSFGYFEGANIPKTLLENTDLNGGGYFSLSPELLVDIPAFSRSGEYSGTITITIV